ncbi:hypothetical protein [Kutzneria albida]|uniref:Uncharacterized protein n=1 Tax=Kutzneria albida DSM 43870 TaxID=1449976 RepID=W5W822_9PSEU|nr:hypothetical protein [Kutzneria albida]AHH97288.1 hypothetical protein KALB_3924 [Kutzneria albida DSM 43870]
MDVRIRTLVESKGELVRLDDATPELRLRRSEHFDGVVLLQVKDRPVIDETVVDDVDWFWGVLWTATKDFVNGSDVKVGMPTLPYELELIHLAEGNAKISFSGRDASVQRFCVAKTLVGAVTAEADSYYRNMIRLAKKQQRIWHDMLDEIRTLRSY